MEKEQDVKVTELKMEDVFDMDFLIVGVFGS